MIDDPIVNEVRKVHDELAKKFNYDVDAIFADLCKKQKKFGNRIVHHIKHQDASQSRSVESKEHN